MADRKTSTDHPPIYRGDEDADRLPYEGPEIRTEPAQQNAGRRAPREGSGVVIGSGAGAGGTGGIVEDYDSDPIGGGGQNVMPVGKSFTPTSEGIMSDDKTVRTPQDARRVNLNEDYEVQYWTNRFGVSHERLRAAVDKVGVSVDAIAEELNG